MGDWSGRLLQSEQTIGPGAALPAFVGDDPSRMAGAGRMAAASLPTDEMSRIKYFASQRFPDEPIEKALDRYFWKDGRLAYRSDGGKSYFEEPKLRAPTSAANIAQYPGVVAGGAGPALPLIGGTLGGLSAIGEGPVGLFTGAPQAAAGGVAGDALRQGLARAVTGEKKSWTDRLLQSAGAGLEQFVGQTIGNVASKGLTFLGKTPTYNIPETSNLRAASEKFDIQLTPGEETGNRTLLRRQKILANTTEGETIFTNFYEGRNEKVGTAVNDLLNRLSPQASPRMGAQAGTEGAQGALKESRRELSGLAGPYYARAIDNNPQRFWTPEVEDLFSRPSMQQAIGAAKKLAAEEGRTLSVPTFENGKRVADEIVPDWRSWDYMKKALDGIVEENTNEAGRVSQYGRSVILTREKMMNILDRANPDWATARGMFAGNVGDRTALEKGVVGDVAKLEGNDVLRAGNIIFGKGSSPEDVSLARSAFEKAGQLDKWNALARSHLQQVFNDIPDSATGAITNIGGTYRKAIFGNKTKRDMLNAAFEHIPGFSQDVNSLMDVLEATGRAMKGESITAFAQAGQKELAKEGGGVAPGLVETAEVWRTPSRIARYWSDLNTSKYAARQAELLTTPEGRTALRELRRLGPGSAGSVLALSHLLTSSSIAAASSALFGHGDGPAVDTPQSTEFRAPEIGESIRLPNGLKARRVE